MKQEVKILLENILKEAADRPKIKLRAMWQDREQRRREESLKMLQREVVDCDVTLMDNENIKNLGNIRHVKGLLNLINCKNLEELPEGLTVKGSLWLENCINLTSLPKGLKVGSWLNLKNCINITEFPDDLKVFGCIVVKGCKDELAEQAINLFGEDYVIY